MPDTRTPLFTVLSGPATRVDGHGVRPALQARIDAFDEWLREGGNTDVAELMADLATEVRAAFAAGWHANWTQAHGWTFNGLDGEEDEPAGFIAWTHLIVEAARDSRET